MPLTDEQLMLLEQLTYLSDEIIIDMDLTPGGPISTVEEYIEKFDEAALERIEQMDYPGGGTISGEEWAAIFRAIKSDDQLMDLEITDIDDEVYAMCFEDPNHPGEAIVAFRGTSGQKEWEDNTVGLYDTDTECQKAALEYIEGLPYESITVTGHSKGGNKAQYVTILSDKVTRCVSMDGQGFSQEFFDKYYAEIMRKGGMIRNYFVDSDYVNILMFPVPGAEQICIASEDDVVHMYYHNPCAFFQFCKDSDGNWVIQTTADGKIDLKQGNRSAVMGYLQGFTYFILNVMPEDERKDIAVYLGHILGLALDDDAHFNENGVDYHSEDLLKYVFSDPDALGLTLAYFLKYVETYNLSIDDITSLLVFLGIDDYLEEHADQINDMISENPSVLLLVGGGTLTAGAIAELIYKLSQEVRDGETDYAIEALLIVIEKILYIFKIRNINIHAIWRKTEQAYTQIPEFDAATARNSGACPEERIRDFSAKAYEALKTVITTINMNAENSVTGWQGYATEEWYQELGIGNFIAGITSYVNHTIQTNNDCLRKIEAVFDQARQVDSANASALSQVNDDLHLLKQAIHSISNNLG